MGWDDPGGGGGVHPDLAAHDALGLASDAELAAEVAALVAAAAAHAALTGVHHTAFTQADHDALPNPHHSNALDHAAAHAHASHTGIGANDHHPQAHAIDGADHTGTMLTDHNARHEPGGADAMAVDAAAATGSLRTLGGGAAQAAAGDHSHAGGSTELVVPVTSAQITYTNQGAGPTAVVSALNLNGWPVVDLTGFTNVRVACRVVTAGVTADLRLQYSTDGITFSTLTTDTIDLASTGLKQTAAEAIPAAAKALVVIRAVAINGNGTEDPVVGGVTARIS